VNLCLRSLVASNNGEDDNHHHHKGLDDRCLVHKSKIINGHQENNHKKRIDTIIEEDGD
jgi:hypothetical protein